MVALAYQNEYDMVDNRIVKEWLDKVRDLLFAKRGK